MFLAESVSVILQVWVFKATKDPATGQGRQQGEAHDRLSDTATHGVQSSAGCIGPLRLAVRN
mgnify:CR=1 FL=1